MSDERGHRREGLCIAVKVSKAVIVFKNDEGGSGQCFHPFLDF